MTSFHNDRIIREGYEYKGETAHVSFYQRPWVEMQQRFPKAYGGGITTAKQVRDVFEHDYIRARVVHYCPVQNIEEAQQLMKKYCRYYKEFELDSDEFAWAFIITRQYPKLTKTSSSE